MRSLIPSFVKEIFWYYSLRVKHSIGNRLGKRVVLSKDFICAKRCVIGRNTIIGPEVIFKAGVKIGSNCYLEKIEIHDNTCIESGVIITGSGNGHIKIGKECYIGLYNILDWSNDITIGDYVHIAGPSTGLWTHSSAKMCLYGISLNKKSEDFRPTAPITVGSNTYIGGNCTIYPGISIGNNSIVAPNSAVTRDVLPHTMVGGVPARVIKKLVSK